MVAAIAALMQNEDDVIHVRMSVFYAGMNSDDFSSRTLDDFPFLSICFTECFNFMFVY